MTTRRRKRLEIQDVNDVTVVNFVDQNILDEQNIRIIGEELFALVHEQGKRKVRLDFADVEYFSSVALGKLIALNKMLEARSGQLTMCNMRREVYEVFELTQLDKLFHIEKTQPPGLSMPADG